MRYLRVKEFLRGEFIGNKVVVCDARMTPVASGMVTWETKNMIYVGSPEKRFDKRGHTFIFETDEGRVTVEGRRIMFRPEDRIKRLR